MDEAGGAVNLLVFAEREWGQPLVAEDERAIHIREVLRPELGQGLKVGLIGQGRGTAVYRGKSGNALHLDFPDRKDLLPGQAALPITLILGHPRPPVMQRLLKDLNAAGVARIFAVASELSEKSYMQSRLWQGDGGDRQCLRFLAQGAQQGGQIFFSQVRRFYSLHKSLVACGPGQLQAADGLDNGAVWNLEPINASIDPKADQIRLFCDISPTAPLLLEVASNLAARLRSGESLPAGGLVLAIGPERGWSERERQMLLSAGFQPLGLGPSIIRTETACNLAVGMLAMAIHHGA